MMIHGVGRRSLHVNIIAPPPPLMGALMYILYMYCTYIAPALMGALMYI